MIATAILDFLDVKCCPEHIHLRYKADAATFLLHTEHWHEVVGETDRILSGQCLRCGNGLSIYVGSALAVAALRTAVPR